MRDEIENFISQVVLSTTYNIYTGGNVEAPTGYFGTMTFAPNEYVIDGMDTPTEFLGRTVIAVEDSNGNIEYSDILSEELAKEWFEAQEERHADWSGDDYL